MHACDSILNVGSSRHIHLSLIKLNFNIRQGLGALWYLLSMERQNTCWLHFCKNESEMTGGSLMCKPNYLDCKSLSLPERHTWLNATRVFDYCHPGGEDLNFNFGIFSDALTNEFLDSSFLEKYLYCLWWGLRNLRYPNPKSLIFIFHVSVSDVCIFLRTSSYAQNLETSTYVGETIFCILICIVGLVLFSHLIGNMQVRTYIHTVVFHACMHHARKYVCFNLNCHHRSAIFSIHDGKAGRVEGEEERHRGMDAT